MKEPDEQTWLDRLLGRIPKTLSGHTFILLLVLLFFYLFVFAGIETLLGHPSAVSANAQLILGNLTNVTSAMGACIAAGMTVHLSHEQRKRHKELSDLKALVHRLHEKHDAVHPEAADIDRS